MKLQGEGKTAKEILALFCDSHGGALPASPQLLVAFARSHGSSLSYGQLNHALKFRKSKKGKEVKAHEKTKKKKENEKEVSEMNAEGILQQFCEEHSGHLPSNPKILLAYAQHHHKSELPYGQLSAALAHARHSREQKEKNGEGTQEKSQNRKLSTRLLPL